MPPTAAAYEGLRQGDSDSEDDTRPPPKPKRLESEPANPFTQPTYLLLLLVIVVDKADMSLVPAVFLEISQEFDAGPALLGTVTLCRGLAQAGVALLAGPLGNRFSRVKITGAGCLLWGVATAGVGSSTTATQLLLARAVNGLGLGLVIPIAQSLVSDLFPSSKLGRAFGLLACCSNIGGTIGAAAATSIADQTLFGGVPGWRFVFFVSAVVSCATGLLVMAVGRDPRAHATDAPPPLSIRAALGEMGDVWRLQSFKVVIAQGVVGTMPWYAFSFLTLWFELLGFSHRTAAGIRMAFDIGCTCGNLIGGAILDAVNARFPDHGKASVAQVSVGSGIAIAAVIFYSLPGASALVFGAMFLWFGGMISWCGSVNNAVFADVTPQRIRSTIYSLDRVLEGIVGAASAPLVGLIAEGLGFSFTGGGGSDAAADDEANGAALGASLGGNVVVPWLLCFLAYCFLHRSYPRDRDAASRAAAKVVASTAP